MQESYITISYFESMYLFNTLLSKICQNIKQIRNRREIRMIENGKNPEQEERGNNHTSSRSLSKGDILEIKNEIVGALEKSKKRPGILDLFKGIGFTLVFTAGLLGYYIQWHADIKQRESDAKSRAAVQIQKTIDQKIAWMEKINIVAANLKGNIERIQLGCKNGKPLSIEGQSSSKLEERIKVLNVVSASEYIFNREVGNVLRKYLVFDAETKDVCAPNIDGEMEWRKILIKANELMGQSIKYDQKELIKLNTTK